MTQRLEGKVALISGAASGIGAATLVSRRELRQMLLARDELIDGPHPRLAERARAKT